MIRQNENGGRTEVRTAGGGEAVQGSTRTTLEYSTILALVRDLDENATDGAHRCEDERTGELCWFLNREDWLAARGGGEPAWTVLVLCQDCQKAARHEGCAVYPTEWKVAS